MATWRSWCKHRQLVTQCLWRPVTFFPSTTIAYASGNWRGLAFWSSGAKKLRKWGTYCTLYCTLSCTPPWRYTDVVVTLDGATPCKSTDSFFHTCAYARGASVQVTILYTSLTMLAVLGASGLMTHSTFFCNCSVLNVAGIRPLTLTLVKFMCSLLFLCTLTGG